MPSLEKEQLLEYLETNYRNVVRKNRVGANRDEEERSAQWESAFPGRALGCFYLQTVHGLTPDDAAKCDVDGGEDEGIDFIHYDAEKHLLVLGQGKGGGDGGEDQPSLNECLRFFDGVRMLLRGELDSFKELTSDQRNAVLAACADTDLKVELVIAHFGGELDERRTSRAEKIKADFDAVFPEPRMEFVNFGLLRAHAALLKISSVDSVDCRLTLKSYAEYDGEYRCVYGRVLAADLKKLHDDLVSREALYARNVRYYRGCNPVNQKVQETVQTSPELLFYLNNGVTALCRNFIPTPASAANPGREGEFKIEGLTIVNGAQTIGTLAAELSEDDELAYVSLKLIEVGEDGDEIADRITNSTNFQTVVENIDFLSTHRRHEYFVKTLAQSGVIYEFRRSAGYGVSRDRRFTLNEAVETRICSIGITDQIWKLKKAPAGLHSDLRKQIGMCFSDSLSARKLWREIQMDRIIQDSINSARDSQTKPRGKTFFSHGALVLRSIIFAKSRSLALEEELFISEEQNVKLSRFADKVLVKAHAAADNPFRAGGRPWNTVFKTLRDIQDVRRTIMAAIKDINLGDE